MEKQIIYKNPLSCPEDVKDFIMEGKADVYFVNQKMRMKNRPGRTIWAIYTWRYKYISYIIF